MSEDVKQPDASPAQPVVKPKPKHSKTPLWIFLGVVGLFIAVAVTNKGGDTVENSGLDGSVKQVETYLKANLKDPDSYESIEWGKVVPMSSGFTVYHKYRAKNSFGGFVVSSQIFSLDAKGRVLTVTDRE